MGVGKTALFHRILYDSIPEASASHYEDGLERGVYCMNINGEEVKVRHLCSIYTYVSKVVKIGHSWP